MKQIPYTRIFHNRKLELLCEWDEFTMRERPNIKASRKLVEQAGRCKKIRLTTKHMSTKGGNDNYA